MMNLPIKYIISLVLIVKLESVSAQLKSETGIFYDQDYTLEMLGLPKLNEDRNYTMGIGIYYASPKLKKSFLFKPLYWFNNILGRSVLNDAANVNPDITNSLMIANASFTPDSLPATYAIYNDRPYAAVTYLQSKTSFTDLTNLTKRTAWLNIGFIGTAISRETQTAIHKAMNKGDTRAPRTPRGWHYQISPNGEPTLQYGAEFEKLLQKKYMTAPFLKTSIWGTDFRHGIKYMLGYYTGISYTFNIRSGKIDPRNWTYDVNPLGSSSRIAAAPLPNRPTSEYYFFLSVRPVFMLYNALLNGQFAKSDVVLSFGDMNHLFLESDIGLAIAPTLGSKTRTTLNLKFCSRSPEFHLPNRPPRWHYWGGIDVRISKY